MREIAPGKVDALDKDALYFNRRNNAHRSIKANLQELKGLTIGEWTES